MYFVNVCFGAPFKSDFFIFQGVQQTLEDRQNEFESALEHYNDITASRRFVRRESVQDKCDNLKEKWTSLSSSVPWRINTLHQEIKSWSEFYHSLDRFTSWLDEKKGFTQQENPKGEIEAQQHLQELEVSRQWRFFNPNRTNKMIHITYREFLSGNIQFVFPKFILNVFLCPSQDDLCAWMSFGPFGLK